MKKLDEALANLEEKEVGRLVDEKLKTDSPMKIVEELSNGMQKIGELYEKGEAFLSEMLLAAQIFSEAMTKIRPVLQIDERGKGKVVLATVQGDIHTIGKNIVATFLETAQFSVIDIGEDVAPEEFLKKIKELEPGIAGMSSLLTTGVEPIRKTVQLMEEQGLRRRVKVLIGGAPISLSPELWLREVKADDYGKDAVDAVRKVKMLLG